MTITRAQTELLLVARAKKLMQLVDFEVTTTGQNADLVDPLSTALRRMGKPSASPAAIKDSDLADVSDDEIEELLDRSELRLLQNILGNFDLVDFSSGPRRESLSQARAGLEKRIDDHTNLVSNRYGDDTPELQAGVIQLDYQQTDEQ